MATTAADEQSAQTLHALACAAGQRVAFSVEALRELLENLSVRRPLVVIDRTALEATNAADRLHASLTGTSASEFGAFHPNPAVADALAAGQQARAHKADGVVAIGGGSCIDTAKVAALSATRGPEREAWLAVNEAPLPLPIVAIPTTSGSGAEATCFAAVYDNTAHGPRKQSIENPGVRPAAVVLDATLHRAMPPRLAACTGLDALCQAAESLWAKAATAQSAAFARAAGLAASGHLEPSVLQAGLHDRRVVMLAAYLAGCAINQSRTTLPHALSYAITTRHGIPHGHAVALTLGFVARANANAGGPAADAVAELARWLRCDTAGIPDHLAGLLRRLGLPASLREAGVPRRDLQMIAESVDPLRASNNPAALTQTQLHQLLDHAWAGSS